MSEPKTIIADCLESATDDEIKAEMSRRHLSTRRECEYEVIVADYHDQVDQLMRELADAHVVRDGLRLAVEDREADAANWQRVLAMPTGTMLLNAGTEWRYMDDHEWVVIAPTPEGALADVDPSALAALTAKEEQA